MERNVYDVLTERGFIEQATHPDDIRELLGKEKVTFYIGFDPTADSLHVGHYIQFMVMQYMQKYGHRPIFLAGGGTGMIGDPSGRSDMRRVMTIEQIDSNVERFKAQASRFVDFSDGKALMLNNAEWLRDLNYIEFLRDYGAHFSINRMINAECYKSRLEQGLTFLEFNYMIMQSYDFLHLYRHYDCKLQFGGNDQWSNIIGGVELVRRADQGEAFGLTFKLLTNSEGKKMGKTANGAVWLDPEKMKPFDFYQYWRNVDDKDVRNCLCLLTFLPMDEVERLASLEGAEINKAKEVLAYEVTKNVHGMEAAEEAQKAARALFAGASQAGSIPTTDMTSADFAGDGVGLLNLLKQVGLTSTTSEGRRLVEQNGISLNENPVSDVHYAVTTADFVDKQLKIRKGKKKFHIIQLTD
ncbi:MAG: tyrosine--tRNA ligase [Peptococcaceae bacterium]|nr:tyrosine--tRNA ligase [Peptococcaceae bacterium]